MLNIASQKLPITFASEVIKIDLEQARTHQEKAPGIANYFYERVENALHKLAKHEDIKPLSFYDKRHYFRSARTPETSKQEALRKSIADVHFERGEVLSRLDRLDEAKAQYQKAWEWGHSSAQEKLKLLAQLHSSSSNPFSSLKRSSSKFIFHADLGGFTQPPKSLLTPVPYAEESPAFKFFLKNLPLTPPALPQAGQLLRNTEQLAYCLLLLGLDKEEPASVTKLSPEESAWLARVKQDQNEKEEFSLLTKGVICAFDEDPLKNAATVAEVVALAPVYTLDDFQKLLNKFITALNALTLLDVDLLHGLSQLIRHAPPESLRTDDLVKILKKLATLLEDAHTQDGEIKDENRYRLMLATCQVLDAMADNHVTDLDREALHQPLEDFFIGMKSEKDPYLVYQAEYAYQALAYVPDNEIPWQSVWRRSSSVFQGTMKFVKAAKAFDVNGFIDGIKDLREPIGELIQFTLDTYDHVTELKESGQELIESLKEGFSFDRKYKWYPMLRGFDEVPANQLEEFKQKLVQPDLKTCCLHKTFLWGLSERLGRIAAHPEQAPDTQKKALQWLSELYENDETSGKHPMIKQRVVQIIRALADNSSVKEDANALLTRLGEVGDTHQKTFYRDKCLTSPLSPYPLYEARPQPIALSLLDKAQNKQWLETELRRLKAQRLAHWRDMLYVPPRGKASLSDADMETFDLAEKAQTFFDNNKKMALVLGESGAGKSTFLRFLEIILWEKYKKGGIIPLFIALPTIDKPEHDLIAKHLRRTGFTQVQIKTLKETREFVVIADGYDESGSNENLYQSNQFNHPGGWQGQLLVGGRSQHLGANYRQRFQPGNPILFQEWVVAPFRKEEVDKYVQEHVRLKQTQREVVDYQFDLLNWEVKDYQRALKKIDESFKRTPLLLKIALGVLPRLLSLEKQDYAASSSLTKAILYDEAMKARFEREKQRLQGEELTDALKDAFDVLDGEGFVKHCMQFVTNLAVAVYEKNKGYPVVEYNPFKDKGTWKEAFFGDAPRTRILRKVWPLIRNGDQYRFEHKSFLEYFVTLDICQPRDVESTAVAEMESVRQSAIVARRGSATSLLSFESPHEQPEANVIEAAPLLDSLLTRSNLIKEPAIIQFLAERVQTEPHFKQQLHAFILHFKTDVTVRKATANAITILVRAGEQFNGVNLNGIQIPGADLSHGVLDSAQLQGADLRKVNLRNSWLRQANLSGAKMEGVQFGEWPYLKEKSAVNSCAYSPDGKTCAVGLGNGQIKVYATSNWEEIFSLTGHTAPVWNVVYSPSGEQIASASDDHTVRLWDVQSGQLSHTLEGHTDYIKSVAYSPSGQQIASASANNMVRLWDTQSGQLSHTLAGHTAPVRSVVYSPDGEQIASASDDHTMRLWDTQSGQLSHTLAGHTAPVWNVVYSPSGEQIASAGVDHTVRLWDVQSGQLSHTLAGHTDYIKSVVYSPSGQQLASASWDKTVQLWDAQNGQHSHILDGHTAPVRSVVYSPSGEQIASASADHTVRLWDTQSGQYTCTLAGHTASVLSVVYSPSGEQIASRSEDKTMRLWDTQNGQLSHTLAGHTASILSVAYSPSGEQIASLSEDKAVRLWDTQSGQLSHTLAGHTASVLSVVYSPDGKQIASASRDNMVRLWDAQSGQCSYTLAGHSGSVNHVVYSPNGQQIASASRDNTVRLWDAHTGEPGHTLQGHTDTILDVVYSPSGQQLASVSSDNTVRLWDAQSGQCSYTLADHASYVNSVAYSLSGEQIASASHDNTVRLWDAQSGQLSHTLLGHTHWVWNAVYSPNGQQIASRSEDKTVRLWDAQSGQLSHTLRFKTAVWSMVYSPSSRQLASASGDNMVRLWDAWSGQLSHTLAGHTDYIKSVAYSPNGQQIASASHDKTVRLWDVQSGQCLAVVRDFWGAVKSIAWKETTNGTYLVTGCEDKSVRVWQIVEDEGHAQVRLHWSSTHDRLTLTNMVIQGVQGLSRINQKLLQQREAVGEPASR